jgi:hypothetical protein
LLILLDSLLKEKNEGESSGYESQLSRAVKPNRKPENQDKRQGNKKYCGSG